MNAGVSRGPLYGFSMLRVIFLLLLAFFLPRLFSAFHTIAPEPQIVQPLQLKLGIENLTESLISSLIASKSRIALIADHTSVTQDGKTTLEVLKNYDVPIAKAFFLDEHSHRCAVKSAYAAGIACFCMPNLSGTRKEFGDIDIILFDIQDGGNWPHSTIALVQKLLAYCAQDKKKLIICDRPNIMGGIIEGAFSPLADNKLLLPIRYGMTVGEIARFIHEKQNKSAALTIVPMLNYRRMIDDICPSYLESMNSLNTWYDSTFLYPLSLVGPFETGSGNFKMQCILLPETTRFNRAKWHELRVMLQEIGIESSFHRSFNKQKKYYVSGLRLFVHDVERFSSVNALVTILKFFKQSGVSLSFAKSFDDCVGTHKLRGFIMGLNEWEEVEQDINKQLKFFYGSASQTLLYKPAPKISLV
jgi:uncharacterized protein YbbC (DUF1343 family)